MVLKPKLFEHFRNPSNFYYFLLFLLLKNPSWWLHLNEKLPSGKRKLKVLAFIVSITVNCYLLKQWSMRVSGINGLCFLATDTQFVATLPERFSANTQFLGEGGFAHIFLIL